MARFKHYDDNPTSMVVINDQDQLQPSTFEHAVYYLFEYKLDLSILPQILQRLDCVMKCSDRSQLLHQCYIAFLTDIRRALKWLNCDINIVQPDDWLVQ